MKTMTDEEWLSSRVDQAIAEPGPFKDQPRDAVTLMFGLFRNFAEQYCAELPISIYESVEAVKELWERGFLIAEMNEAEQFSFRLEDGSKGILERMAEAQSARERAQEKRERKAQKRIQKLN